MHAEAGQFLLYSEGLLLKQENLAEMEQRVFDAKNLYFALFFITVRTANILSRLDLAKHIWFMSALIISSFKWVSVVQALLYSRSEFSFHEREFLLFFGSLNPVALTKKIGLTAPLHTYGVFNIGFAFNFYAIQLGVFLYGVRDKFYNLFVAGGIIDEMDDFFSITWDARLIGPLCSNFWFDTAKRSC